MGDIPDAPGVHGIAIASDLGKGFASNGGDNIESTSEIVAIDARSAKIVKRFALGRCQHPSGRSMDRVHRRSFTACQGEMGVVDADSGDLITTLPAGAGTDATRFDPSTQLAFASNGRAATLTVDPATGIVNLVTAKLIENPNATSYRDRYHVVPGTFELLSMQP